MKILKEFLEVFIILLGLMWLCSSKLESQNVVIADYDLISRLIEEENDSCITYIDSLLKESENDQNLVFSKGLYYDKKDKVELAKYYYYQTIGLDSMHFNGYYNLGVIYYNQGVEAHNICIDPITYEEHLEIVAKGQNYYILAKVYFEKAKAINPDDQDLLDIINELSRKLE